MTEIIVNAVRVNVESPTISYEQIRAMTIGGNAVVTVTASADRNRTVRLVPGESIEVTPGLIINAGVTNNA